jgi:hypothetical protein
MQRFLSMTTNMMDDEISRMLRTRDLMPLEEFQRWVASREEAGLKIDIETCEIGRWYADGSDPYGVRMASGEWDERYISPDKFFFVRFVGSRGWICEGDLPSDAHMAFVKLLAEHKVQVLATLARRPSDLVEPFRWRERFTARSFEWFRDQRSWEEARQLAWGDLQNEWHERHGKRWSAWQCAGCDSPIGRLEALNLPDGNRVHLEPISCLITFGNRWRAEADAALVALGLDMPVESDGGLSRREADAQTFQACKIELLNRNPAPSQIHPATQPTTHRSPALVQSKIGRPPMRDRNVNIGIVMGKLAKEVGENFSRNHRPMLLNFGRYKSQWLEDFTVVDFVSLLGALRDEGLEYLATTPDALLI